MLDEAQNKNNLIEKADALLKAASEFWEAAYEANKGCNGAVQWLQDTDGRLVIFTRNEYKHRLMENISSLYSSREISFVDGDMLCRCEWCGEKYYLQKQTEIDVSPYKTEHVCESCALKYNSTKDQPC